MSAAARAITPLILFAAIVVSFALAIVFGIVQLLWLGQPAGANGLSAAFVCLAIFSGASVALLVLKLRDEGQAGL